MRPATKWFLLASLASGAAVIAPVHATDYTVLMNGDYAAMFFDPASISIQPGDRVRWRNVTIEFHTSTSGEECAPNGIWAAGTVNPGEASAFVTFNTAGTFPYYCRFHCFMGMTGDIIVQQPLPVKPSTWGRIKALYAPKPQ